MIRILLLVIGLAAYGAYSLMEKAIGTSPIDVAAADQTSTSLSELAINTAIASSGFKAAPLPDSGCVAGVLQPQNLEALLDQIPEAQRATAERLVGTVAAVAQVQAYAGDQGLGVCLPGQQKLILLPDGISQAVSSFQLPSP